MKRTAGMRYRLVHTIPRGIDEGVLYVSREYATAVHKCCCGCGHEVVTPLGPSDWTIRIDRGAVSVYPSVGNWSLACRSHYWITRGRIRWAERWSDAEIRHARERDRMAKQRMYREADRQQQSTRGFWSSLWRWLTRK